MPTPFTAEIVFTGVCGVVPKKNHPNPPEGFCVLLPNAWSEDPDSFGMRVSLDNVSRLRRHTPFVYFTTHPPEGMNKGRDLEGLWFLDRHRLVVEPKFVGTEPEPEWGDIAGLARFEDIANDELQSHLSVEKAVTAPHGTDKVAAQVVLHHGTLSSVALDVDWVFEGFLRPKELPVIKRLNHRFTVTLENLTELKVVRQNLEGKPTGRSFTFSEGPAFITVANLCDQNPLQWGLEPPPESLTDDDDFRWHYEIVDNPVALSTFLDPLRCPIPRLARVPALEGGRFFGGGGLSCVGFCFPAVDFSF